MTPIDSEYFPHGFNMSSIWNLIFWSYYKALCFDGIKVDLWKNRFINCIHGYSKTKLKTTAKKYTVRM